MKQHAIAGLFLFAAVDATAQGSNLREVTPKVPQQKRAEAPSSPASLPVPTRTS